MREARLKLAPDTTHRSVKAPVSSPVAIPAPSGVTPEHWPMSAACHLELGGSEAGEAWPAAGRTLIEDLDGIRAWRDGGDLDLDLVGAERRYGLLSEKLHGRPRNRGQGRRRATQDRPPFVEVEVPVHIDLGGCLAAVCAVLSHHGQRPGNGHRRTGHAGGGPECRVVGSRARPGRT